MNQMPTREEIQAAMAMQNMPTPTAPASSMPKFNLPQMQSTNAIWASSKNRRWTNIDV
jgi:hypothetical protein